MRPARRRTLRAGRPRSPTVSELLAMDKPVAPKPKATPAPVPEAPKAEPVKTTTKAQ